MLWPQLQQVRNKHDMNDLQVECSHVEFQMCLSFLQTDADGNNKCGYIDSKMGDTNLIRIVSINWSCDCVTGDRDCCTCVLGYSHRSA